MRALAALRLSRATDDSTSIERQREVVTNWAGSNDATVVGEAVDLDVSGSVSPWEREGLGEWLTDTPPERWDALVAWKLDRVSRSAIDTWNLVEWLEKRGKFLIAVSDGIDTRTTMGQFFVKVTALFAELERKTIQERTRASREALRKLGRWGGEAIHYGLRSVPLEGGGYKLDLDPVGTKHINEVADWVIAGSSVAEAARRLQSAGVLAPRDRQRQLRNQKLKGDKWSDSTLMYILRSKSLLGWTVTKGEAIPELTKSPPIMTAEKYQRLQIALDKLSKPQTRPRKTSSPLFGVALCDACMQPLHHRAQFMPAGRGRMKTSKTYRYYYCRTKGHTRSIHAEDLEQLTASSFLTAFAESEVTEPVEIPPTDHTEAIAAAQLAVESVSTQLAIARSESVRNTLTEQLRALDDRLAELEALPNTPGGIEYVPTGRTWAQELETLDDEERRLLWNRVGFQVRTKLDDDGVTFGFNLPEGSPLAEGAIRMLGDKDEVQLTIPKAAN